MIFDGHLRVADSLAEKKATKPKQEEEDNGTQGAEMSDQVLPPLESGQGLDLLELSPSQHFTKPPPRYTEASLVRALEKEGIGRPSTYAPILSTIQDRGYVERQGRQLHPTELGVLVTDKLVRHFPDIMDIKFTSGMEENLDRVEDGADWIRTTREFYDVFKKDLDKAIKEMERVSLDHHVDVICDKCGKKMVVRLSKHGKFLGCSGYPDCENKKPFPGSGGGERPAERPEPEVTDEKCDLCGKPMIVRLARRGRSRGSRFLSCSGYPNCKSIKPYSTGVPCPKEGCGGVLVEKAINGRVFYGCSRYPECRHAVSELPPGQGKDAPSPANPAPANATPDE
jgi:DNA topoisomerase-1